MEFEDPRSPEIIKIENDFFRAIDNGLEAEARKYFQILDDMLHPGNPIRKMYKLQLANIISQKEWI